MKKPNPKKQILTIPYHKVMDRKENQLLVNHAKKVNGIVDTELPNYTASDKVAYAGPDGILGALGDKCAYELFIDYGMTNDDDEEGVEADFYLDKGQIWVWANDKIHTIDEWYKVVNDSYPGEDEED